MHPVHSAFSCRTVRIARLCPHSGVPLFAGERFCGDLYLNSWKWFRVREICLDWM